VAVSIDFQTWGLNVLSRARGALNCSRTGSGSSSFFFFIGALVVLLLEIPTGEQVTPLHVLIQLMVVVIVVVVPVDKVKVVEAWILSK